MTLSRLISHGLVLAISASIAGVRFSDQPFTGPHLQPSAVNAAGVGAESSLDSAGTIIKPLAMPVGPVLSHAVVHHTVIGGDTVASIALQHGIPEESVRWSNLVQLSRVWSQPPVGSDLLLPPVAGVALASREGDTFASLSKQFQVDAGGLADFNRVRFAVDEPLPVGLELVVPGGRGPDLAPSAPFSRPTAGFRGGGYTLLGIAPGVPVHPTSAARGEGE